MAVTNVVVQLPHYSFQQDVVCSILKVSQEASHFYLLPRLEVTYKRDVDTR